MRWIAERRLGWTGGQYSVFRAVFGVYLLVHFARLVPWAAELWSSAGVLPDGTASPLMTPLNLFALCDQPHFVTGVLAGAAGLSVMFALGWHDRLVAIVLWCVWASLYGRNPLISNPGLPYVGWMLLAHALLPGAPYGSWTARGRADPGGGWRFTPAIWAAAWIIMAAGYTYSGSTKLVSPSWMDGTAIRHVLENPLARDVCWRQWLLALPDWAMNAMTWGALGLELLFAPLALVRAVRPWLWAAMLSMHLGLMLLIDFADLSMGMVVLHLFTFNPAWIAGRRANRSAPGSTEAVELLFYDGHCGLCHRIVRFVLAEDPDGRAFVFAPLQGRTFHESVGGERRSKLPDSVIVLTAEGELLARSGAVLHILNRLGGAWRVAAVVGRLVPRAMRDWAYNRIAAVRHRLFARPTEACPIVEPSLRARFLN